jgi:hypothetical protein
MNNGVTFSLYEFVLIFFKLYFIFLKKIFMIAVLVES